MDCRWENTFLAIEHKCLRDSELKRIEKVKKLPLRGKVCFCIVRDYHPSFDCVLEWFGRQDKRVVVFVP